MTFSQCIIPILTPSSDIRCQNWWWWSKESFGGWLLEWDSIELEGSNSFVTIGMVPLKQKQNPSQTKHSTACTVLPLGRGRARREGEQTKCDRCQSCCLAYDLKVLRSYSNDGGIRTSIFQNSIRQNRERKLRQSPQCREWSSFLKEQSPSSDGAQTHLLQRTISGLQMSSEGMRMDVTFSYSRGSQRNLQSYHSWEKHIHYQGLGGVRIEIYTENQYKKTPFGLTHLLHPHVRGHHLILLILKRKSHKLRKQRHVQCSPFL